MSSRECFNQAHIEERGDFVLVTPEMVNAAVAIYNAYPDSDHRGRLFRAVAEAIRVGAGVPVRTRPRPDAVPASESDLEWVTWQARYFRTQMDVAKPPVRGSATWCAWRDEAEKFERIATSLAARKP